VAIGYGAAGYNAGVAIGGKGAAGQDGGVAIGWNTPQGNHHGVGIGYAAVGTTYGVAIGFQAQASGNNNPAYGGVAVGYKATGANAGVGIGSEAKGFYHSVAVGSGAAGTDGSSTFYGTAIGEGASAPGEGNVAIGCVGNGTASTVNSAWTDTVELGRGAATLQGGLNFRGMGVMTGAGKIANGTVTTNSIDPGTWNVLTNKPTYTGLTTNFPVIFADTGFTNTLYFTNGLLVAINLPAVPRYLILPAGAGFLLQPSGSKFLLP
jgi:hypothetical protein